MLFASVQELIQGIRQVIELNGGVRVIDPSALRGETIDRLVHTAVFGQGDVRDAARWIIWEAGWQVGVKSASIDPMYQARAREEYDSLTVPAINVRAMAYDFARAIVSSAKRRNVGAFIFELARSEMGYTEQSCEEFATVMMAASIKEGHTGPVFIQGDHYQADAKKYATDPQGVIDGLKKLIREAIAAGYANIDIDTSTLVDLSFPTLKEQQRHNYERCAELAALIREIEPPGVTISIGGEIGEVGKKNSTVDELEAFVQGFNEVFRSRVGDKRGLSKISVNTGSSHGGVVLPDGTIAKVAIDFDTLREMSAAARRYGMGGAVQHGASTLPPEYFHKFPEVGTLEVHLATEFQNIILDHGAFPEDLKQQMYAYIREKLADEWAKGDTEEQFIYKTRKKIWGPFKQQVWTLPEATRAAIRAQLEEKLDFLYEQLGVIDSQKLVQKYIGDPKRITKPQPASLQAAAAAAA
jgi:fructose/tagatose bisphosphate aldolase